jgi:hypothetical protein
MTAVHVCHHAAERYVERVEPCTIEQAKDRILASSKAIHAAASIGCQVVRLACGARLVLDGLRVLTVYPRGDLPHQCRASHHDEGNCFDAL